MDMLPNAQRSAFLSSAKRIAELTSGEISGLIPALPAGLVVPSSPTGDGIFDYGIASSQSARSAPPALKRGAAT
jgi:hypothetical protein